MSEYQVGDLFELSLQTKRKSITDGRGIAFGWSAVPVVIAGPDGEIDFKVEYNEEQDIIQIVLI